MYAYPRVWVDLTTTEVFGALTRLIQPQKVRLNRLVPKFERAYAEFIGTNQAVAFTNCRSTLYFCLKALDLKRNDEIILPAFTFWVDAAVVVLAGLKPVFVDVEFDTMNIDASKIEAAITPKTKVILPAHLNGLPSDMEAIMNIAKKYNLRVIEDCARSCGSRYKGHRVGSFDIGAFSFGYGKSFYGFGGGMATSNDRFFINRLRKQKDTFSKISYPDLFKSVLKGCILKYLNTPSMHGFTLFPFVYRFHMNGNSRFSSWFTIKKPFYNEVPETFKMDMYDIQARMGFRQIRTIDSSNSIRKQHLKILNKGLSGIDGLNVPLEFSDRDHVCVHYAVWSKFNKSLQEFLLKKRIDAQNESAEDLTQMNRFKKYATGDYPNARRLNNRVIYIPSHPCLSSKELHYIIKNVRNFFKYN